ncbi:High-affinity choline uptake protein BetT [Serinicoccus hydrothermalis]|uniref:High-affinity choline uptake protein BetT n=1 Tax=Serinicoccus hydrothermalis TaxID=1758689 RepID=A0A1B1N8P3_9MICO|nr:BCCT family transporter [Serinicoccus hydrothermalis]ANS77807.1 High-affinity choline uptake protein BetT [Serinicoccus hydrothermalis]
MDALAQRLGLRTNPQIFFTSAGLMVLILALLLIFPASIGAGFAAARTWVTTNLGWFFILGVTAWLIFLIWIAISRFGSLKLGKGDEEPAYGKVSWFTMLFAGGIGTILMFWGVAEPISHFTTPPFPGVEPYSATAAEDAMNIALYHLGLHTWAIFTLPGLAFGFFIYRYDLPMRVSSVFYPFLKERIHGPIGKTIDVFAVLGTVFGLAVSLGLGTSQISAGLSELTGVGDNVLVRVLVITVLTAVATTSVAVGLDKGIKRLSNLNIGMAVGMMLFVLFTGGATVFLLRELVESAGNYIAALPALAFWNDALANTTQADGWGWQAGWTVFYWAWTVTWAPFMGVFLARISRGRTVREFIGGVLVAPSLFTLIWFVIFGWSAMNIDGIGGDGGPISAAVAESVPLAMFTFFENFPWTPVMQGLVVVIVALFFATSADSAALVIDMLCSGDEEEGPVPQRAFWAFCLGALAALLIVLGGDEAIPALQEVITVVGLPIFILVFAMIPALLIGLRSEKRRVERGDDSISPQEEILRDSEDETTTRDTEGTPTG